MAGAADGRVVIDTSLNNKGFIKGVNAMKGQLGGLQSVVSRLGAAIGAAFAVRSLVSFGRKAAEIGSDIAEVQNVVDVAFGELRDKAERFAGTAITQFGMSTLAAKRTASTYMAMARGMGVASSEAADMAITLAGLSGDVASFFNISQELADVKLKSVFTGETETLKDLGVVMTQDNLKAYALSKGFKKSYEAMTQAEKTALRYRFVLDSLALANGDFARTQDSWANQTRILSMQWQEFMGVLGQSIITVLKPVVKWLNTVVAHLIALANMLNGVVSRAFGGEKKQTAQAEAVSSAIASSVENQNALTDAVEGTNKAQQKSLAGFDEINRLAEDAAGGGSAGGGPGVDYGAIELPDMEELTELDGPMFDSWGEAFSAFLDLLLSGIPGLKAAFRDFAEWLNELNQKLYDMFTFPGVLEKVRRLGRELADALNELVEAIDWELWGRALGAGLNLALNFLTSFLYEFDWIGLGKKLAAFINGLVDEIDWYEFGRLLWAKFKLGLETLAGFILGLDMPALAQAAGNIVKGFFNSMQESIASIDWAGIGRQIAEFLNHIDWAGVIASIAGAFREMVGAALELIGGFISNADPGTLLLAAALLGAKLLSGLLRSVIAPLAQKIGSNLIEKIAEAITGGGIGSILSSIGTALSSLMSSIAGIAGSIAPIVAVVGGAILAIGNFVEMLGSGFNWLNEALMLVGVAIAAVGAVILGVPATVAATVAGIVAAVATAAVLVKEHWEEIGEFFSQLFENIGGWASETLDGICAYWSGVGEWWNENVITPIAEFFTQLGEDITAWAAETWDNIVSVWEAVSGWFDENVIQPVGQFFSDMWSSITQWACETWNSIVQAFQDAGHWFEEHVTGPIGKAFEAAAEFIKGVINGIIGTVEGMINTVIKAVNWLIAQLNKLKIDIPDNPITGAVSIGFSIPAVSEVQLPRLARGAVIPPNREFMAVLGDQASGNNLEAPEELIRKIVREEAGGNNTALLEAILEAVRAGHIIMVDRKILGRTVTQEQNRATRQFGRSVVLG